MLPFHRGCPQQAYRHSIHSVALPSPDALRIHHGNLRPGSRGDDEMARLAMSHARVDRRAPVTSRVVSRVYRSGLLWATIVGLLVT